MITLRFISYLLKYVLCRAPRIGIGGRAVEPVAHRVALQ